MDELWMFVSHQSARLHTISSSDTFSVSAINEGKSIAAELRFTSPFLRKLQERLIELGYEATHDANIASAVAGQSKTSITMNRYSHARQDAVKKGMNALDEAYHL